MSFNQVLFRDLILETKDGDWGKDEEKAGFVPYRVIRGGDFPHVEIGDISKVPRCYLKESTVARRTLKAGDILIETAGGTKNKPTGRVVYISQELLDKFDLSVTCASFARFLRIDEEKVNPKFIFWYLRNMYEKGEMWQHQVQHTGVARFQWTKFADGFMLDLPTRARQNEAVKVLDSLYEKIIANLGINQTLESMAQTIFKSWFVDFEPVKAKITAIESGEDAEGVTRAAMRAISGKTDDELNKMEGEQSEEYVQLKSTAELFPSAMQDSELGEVPEGWGVGTVKDIVTRLKTKKRYTKKQVMPYGRVPVLEQGADIILGYHDDEAGFTASPDKSIFIFGDHTCITYLSCQPFDISQNVIPLEGNKLPTVWVYYAVKDLQSFQEYRRHWSEFSIKPVIVPDKALIENYSELAKLFYTTKENNINQSAKLSQLRDTLLPKLMSGDIRVKGER